MSTIKDLVSRLHQPFPYEESRQRKISSAALVAIFVGVFLFATRPGNMNELSNAAIAWLCFGFALASFVTSCLYDFITHDLLGIETNHPSWTLSKWIAHCSGLICLIALSNLLLLGVWFGYWQWKLGDYFVMLFYTWLVGIFPIVFSGLIIQMRAQAQHLATAKALVEPLQRMDASRESHASANHITLTATDNQQLTFAADAFYYAEAMQNYVRIAIIEQDQIQFSMLRMTMQSLEDSFSGQARILRCHRSYVVNLEQVEHIQGNAQGLQLSLRKLKDFTVPVSRAYVNTIRNALEQS